MQMRTLRPLALALAAASVTATAEDKSCANWWNLQLTKRLDCQFYNVDPECKKQKTEMTCLEAALQTIPNGVGSLMQLGNLQAAKANQWALSHPKDSSANLGRAFNSTGTGLRYAARHKNGAAPSPPEFISTFVSKLYELAACKEFKDKTIDQWTRLPVCKTPPKADCAGMMQAACSVLISNGPGLPFAALRALWAMNALTAAEYLYVDPKTQVAFNNSMKSVQKLFSTPPDMVNPQLTAFNLKSPIQIDFTPANQFMLRQLSNGTQGYMDIGNALSHASEYKP